MKTVVYLINQLKRSGPVNVLYNIVANLDYTEYKPIIIKLMQDDPAKSVTGLFEAQGIEVIGFNFSFWDLELRTIKVAEKINSCLCKFNADILHSHGYHPLLISSYIKKDILKIDTQHCISIDSFRSSRGYIVGTYMHYRYRERLKKVTVGVAISESVKEYYHKSLPDLSQTLIYNGIDVVKFDMQNYDKSYWKEKIGVSGSQVLYVVVGHLSKLKNPLYVIKTFTSLLDKGFLRNTTLLFCGSGTEENKCKRLAYKYPQIIFKGFVPNVSDYLRAADVSICASKSEGFGLNFIEALASNALVLSNLIPAFNEFSSIYPKLQKYQFSTQCQESLESRLCEIEREGLEDINDVVDDVKNRFSATQMALEYMKLYEKCLFV